jgi:Superinfection immunity protein/Protein of unknown function (DUF2510)
MSENTPVEPADPRPAAPGGDEPTIRLPLVPQPPTTAAPPAATPAPRWEQPSASPVGQSGQSGPSGLSGPTGQYWAPAAQPAWQQPAVLTDRRQPETVVLVTAWVLTVLTVGYLLPWAIAASRGRSNQAAIGLLNFFLGWTFIGWVASLVMACQSHQVLGQGGNATVIVAAHLPAAAMPPARSGPAAGWYPSPAGPGQQYWDGQAWTEHRAP